MHEIYLEGDVGAAFWGDDAHFTPADVRAALEGQGDVTIYLNSGGGIATEGLAIYHQLRAHPGVVHVVITGVAASAASLIAMAGDTITLRAGALLMIHDPAQPFAEGRGTEEDHLEMAQFLARMSAGYAGIYAERAGISVEAARDIMRAETWFTPHEAVAAGFATATDAAESQAAATFAYRVYANTPRHLLAGTRADGPAKRAVMAMICGVPAKPKETTMSKAKVAVAADDQVEDLTDATAIEDAEDDTADEGAAPDDGTPEGEDTAPGDAPADDEDDEDSATAEATAICDLVTMHNGTPGDVRRFIAARATLASVINHYKSKGNSTMRLNPGGPSARITRDERDTRRAGMAEALAAQIGRRSPAEGPARAFMSMSLAEMAAAASGHRGALRTAYDRQQVFMNMHTTGDFPLILSNALNKELEARYVEAEPTYRRISRLKSFKDFRPHPIVRAGDFPTLQPVGEGGEIKYGSFGEKSESVALVPYGVVVALSRQMLINDDIGGIADVIADQGRAVSRFEDATFYAMALGGSGGNGPTLTETSRQMFNTTDKTLASSGAAISITTISAGRAEMRKKTSVNGAKLGLAPRILLVGPATETEAEQIVAPILAATTGAFNPFSGKLEVVSTAEITGNAWYLFADPGSAAVFVHGYLEGASAPRMRMEEVFGQQGMKFSLEHDFGVGAADFRGGYKNAGA